MLLLLVSLIVASALSCENVCLKINAFFFPHSVAEFLLKDRDSIQKFMRKIMWHNYSAEVITIEITERAKSDVSVALGQDGADTSLDSIINRGTSHDHQSCCCCIYFKVCISDWHEKSCKLLIEECSACHGQKQLFFFSFFFLVFKIFVKFTWW